MKGDEKYLVKLIYGANAKFLIPVYQRNYAWNLDNCKQLFQDLKELEIWNADSHFFGSIVQTAGGESRLVIDGQ